MNLLSNASKNIFISCCEIFCADGLNKLKKKVLIFPFIGLSGWRKLPLIFHILLRKEQQKSLIKNSFIKNKRKEFFKMF